MAKIFARFDFSWTACFATSVNFPFKKVSDFQKNFFCHDNYRKPF